MFLADLDSVYNEIKVVILQTPSVKLDTFIRDKVKKKMRTNSDTTLSLINAKDLKNVKSLMNIQPQLSEKWFVDVNVSKFGITKEFIEAVEYSTTCVYFCKVENYRDYKKLKDSFKQLNGVFDYYLPYLKRMDTIYLYDTIVPKEMQMKKPLFDYLVQSYSSDVEAIMTLFDKMKRGAKIEKRKDISEICGIGGNTVESFMFSLLKDPPTTEKGIDKVISNRVKAALELAEVLGYGKFYNFLSSSLSSLLDIKMLLISSTIYKRIINLPEPYDERKLTKYQRYLWVIKNIPTSRIIRCKTILVKNRWSNDTDIFSFIFNYIYNQEKYEVLPYIKDIIPNKDTEEDTVIDDTNLSEEEVEFSFIFENFKKDNARAYNSDEAIESVYNEALRKGLVKEVVIKEEEPAETEHKESSADYFSIITSSAMNIDKEDNLSALDKSGVSLLELAEVLITGDVSDEIKLKLHNSNLAVQQKNAELAKPKEAEEVTEEVKEEEQKPVEVAPVISTGDVIFDLTHREVDF